MKLDEIGQYDLPIIYIMLKVLSGCNGGSADKSAVTCDARKVCFRPLADLDALRSEGQLRAHFTIFLRRR